ncbi:MAG: response regulator transcription factor [Bacteroidales bacterium]|jgi:DNA-binding response OmpR family regulator|nr:response regulator transcription factor [Bacteroidales bacterium]MDY0054114.1 response regulator transcription factor [Bacteroidales bacterium]
MATIKILLAEDDLNLGPILKAYLEQKGYPTKLATDGEMAINMFRTDEFDFIILDVMMPVMDGYQAAREIRKFNDRIPIMFLSAKNQEQDKIRGFEVGADDYLTKPFSMDELLLRILAITRRTHEEKPEDNIFTFGKYYSFDYNKQLIIFSGNDEHPYQELKLTSKESELLRVFAMNSNQIVDRGLVLQKIWKNDTYFNARSMDVYITKLRKYLKLDPAVEIANQHGVGFKLVFPKNVQ